MEFRITLPRNDVAGQPSPLKYLSKVVREGERMGYAYCVIGDWNPVWTPSSRSLPSQKHQATFNQHLRLDSVSTDARIKFPDGTLQSGPS